MVPTTITAYRNLLWFVYDRGRALTVYTGGEDGIRRKTVSIAGKHARSIDP